MVAEVRQVRNARYQRWRGTGSGSNGNVCVTVSFDPSSRSISNVQFDTKNMPLAESVMRLDAPLSQIQAYKNKLPLVVTYKKNIRGYSVSKKNS